MPAQLPRKPHVPLKLLASTAADLETLGALVQDALVPLADMAFLQAESAFVIALNRFCWEDAGADSGGGPWWRTHAALRFENILRVRKQGLAGHSRDRMLSLLALAGRMYNQMPEPGTLILHFSGGAALELTSRAFQCSLTDLGEAWPTRWKPGHDGSSAG